MDFLRRMIGSAATALDNSAIPWKSLIITFAIGYAQRSATPLRRRS